MENNQTQIWERINVFYQSTRKPVNVLIAFNADAAAASATVMSLLKTSLIPFQAHPISNEDELLDIIRESNLAQEAARLDESTPFVDDFFFLIGFGATVNLERFFTWSRHVVVVLDAWRPVHLANMRAEDGERLTLWGSPRIRNEIDTFFREQRQQEALRRRRHRRKEQRRQQKRLRLEYNRAGRPRDGGHGPDAWGADEDSISSNTSQADGRRRQQRRRDPAGQEADAVGPFAEGSSLHSSGDDSLSDESSDSEADVLSADDDDDEDKDAYVAGFSSQEEPDVHWSERPETNEDGAVEDPVAPPLRALYYASECAGKSCALEAYELAVLLNRLQPPMLWHAAVGVGDLFARRLIDYSTYLVEMQPIHDAVSLMRQTTQHALEAYADDAANVLNDGGVSAQLQARATSNNMQLSNVDEELLYLLRHLSLWDAIWCHPLMASALRLHHVEDGEGFLSQLLASRCGVSRERARQPWRELPQDVRKACLPRIQVELQRVLEHAAGFATHPTQLRCIARAVGYSTDVSTFDAFHLFEASLSASPPPSLFVVEESDLSSAAAELERSGAASAGATHTPLELGRLLVRMRLRDFRRQRFWIGHAVIDVDPSEKLFRTAVQEAVELQRSIADATGALMQPGLLQSTRGVHYILPQEALKTTAALESFITVPRLEALGTRLLYTLGVERKRAYIHAVRPLLLSAAVPEPVLRRGASGSNGADARALDLSASGATLTHATAGRGATGPSSPSAGSLQAREDSAYLIVLVHQGTLRGGLTPIPAVGRFLSCIEDEEEFATGLPQRPFTDPHAVLLKGREGATHVVELMHLRSLDRWNPRQEYVARLAAQEEAQRLASYKDTLTANTVDDDDDDDDDSAHNDGRRGRGSGDGDSHRSSIGLLA